MSGSRLPSNGAGDMPRKVAEMLRSDEEVSGALVRASALVRSRGLGPRVVERVLSGAPGVPKILDLAAQGVCGRSSGRFSNLTQAVNSPDHHVVWRAGVMVCYAQFVATALARTDVSARPLIATNWALAETAYWAAGKHIVDPDEAFLSGLLQDTGLVGLVYALPEVYSALARNASPPVLEEFETASFGFDHASVGGYVNRIFKFPEPCPTDAENHHLPHFRLDMAGKVLRAAQVAVSLAGGDFGLGQPKLELTREVLDGALLRPEHEPELLQTASSSLQRALALEADSNSKAA